MCRFLLFITLLVISSVFAFDPILTKEPAMLLDEVFETDFWVMELEEGVNPMEVAFRHGHEFIGQVGTLHGFYLFKKKNETDTNVHFQMSRGVRWFEQQVAKRRSKRSIADPLFPGQWHLHSTIGEPNVNIEGAWSRGITGEGVTIAIVDDGIEYTHPDIAANYNAAASYDFNYGDSDPFPDSARDDHGTSAGGVAAARDNSICGVGSAYRASLSGIRLISAPSTDFQEASSLSYKFDLNHIYSNSWGPIDDGRRKEGPGPLATMALESAIHKGRGGLGSIFVWAGGNGRRSRDNCNYDGWANSRYTIAIPAVDYSGEQAWYSESCSMLVVSAPSSGYGSRSILTTDLMGQRGTSRDDCTSTFGGTSAAAPLAAGVISLILQANPKLGWRDVQAVLIDSAAKHKINDPSWQTNGAGYRYSHNFGFGLIDASTAVLIASDWTNLPPEYRFESNISLSLPIRGNQAQQASINVTESFVVEHVEIILKATHPSRGYLTVTLTSPKNTLSVLAEEHGDSGRDYDWKFGSIVCWGENSFGIWTLSVSDPRDSGGILTGFGLRIFGHLEPTTHG